MKLKTVQTTNPNFSRDIYSQSLINNNIGELQILKLKRSQIQMEASYKTELSNLKKDFEELKRMLLERK